MPDNKSLEERLEQVESLITNLVEKDRDLQLSHHENTCRECARVAALLSLVRELCLHAGISQVQFSQQLEARIAHYRDSYLQKLRDTGAHVSDRLNHQTSGEVPTNRNFGPLFPEDTSQAGMLEPHELINS